MSEVDFKKASEYVSIIKDPFGSEFVESLRINCSKDIFTKVWHYRGVIEFKNGNTEGTQRFEEKDLTTLLKKMQIFVDEELYEKNNPS